MSLNLTKSEITPHKNILNNMGANAAALLINIYSLQVHKYSLLST